MREAAGDALDMFVNDDMTTIKEYVTAGATDPPEKLQMKEKLMVGDDALHSYKANVRRGRMVNNVSYLLVVVISSLLTTGFPSCLL